MQHGRPEVRVVGPAGGRVAGQRLDLRADVAHRGAFVVVADVRDDGHLLDEPAIAGLGLLERGARGVEPADVAQEGDKQRLAVDVRAGDGQLDRDLGSVAAHRLHLEPLAEDRARALAQVLRKPLLVALTQCGRHDQPAEAPPADVHAAVAEGALRGGVEVHDAAARVHRDDAVQGGLEHRGMARFDARRDGVAELELRRVHAHT
jgi:hypothetical protein